MMKKIFSISGRVQRMIAGLCHRGIIAVCFEFAQIHKNIRIALKSPDNIRASMEE